MNPRFLTLREQDDMERRDRNRKIVFVAVLFFLAGMFLGYIVR